MDKVARVCFVLGLAVLAFGYGFLARSWELPPHTVLKQAVNALEALNEYRTNTDYLTFYSKHHKGGVTMTDRAAVAPGLTFVSSYDGRQFSAKLIDLDGHVVYQWQRLFREVWGDHPTHVTFAADNRYLEWHGTHLYQDGSVLFNFEGNMFPFGGGLVKIDKESQILWKLARNTHHAVTVMADGTIWVPSANYRPNGMPELPEFNPWFYEDTILKLSPRGEVLDEISVLLAMRSLPGLFPGGDKGHDPTHINDIELVTGELATAFPMLREGDILVSLRNLNAIVAIDPGSRSARWAMTGAFVLQHDPDLLPNGHVLLFDNRGGDPNCGRSRILEIDPATHGIAWKYDGCVSGDPFYSALWGEQQLLPNGNVLIAESFAGRVIEVTREPKPRIVWSYVNHIGEQDGRPLGGVIGGAHRYAPGELSFVADTEIVTPAEPERPALAITTPPDPG
jgi:hypothetical protein